MRRQFKKGDLVCNSSGILMAVNGFFGRFICCVWLDSVGRPYEKYYSYEELGLLTGIR